jgi:hypothetical protein
MKIENRVTFGIENLAENIVLEFPDKTSYSIGSMLSNKRINLQVTSIKPPMAMIIREEIANTIIKVIVINRSKVSKV